MFDGFRYPTQHPLTIAAGFFLQFFGEWADRLWVALILASFLVLVAGVYRLGKIAATPLVGAIAAALLMTRFDYPFLAARGYLDIPYMALIVWAAILEGQRAAARRSRCWCCSRSRACCGPRRGSSRRCTGAGWRGRRRGASAFIYAALARQRPADLVRGRLRW